MKSALGMPLEYLVDEGFLERMDAQLTGWSDPVARLRDALKKNEFELYCQPILALSGKERYPLAEVLVPHLDRWVVLHAAQALGRGVRLPRLTVNVSGQTLEDAQFLPHVAATLKKHRTESAALLFEIDESDVLARLDAATRFANGAKALGCGVLIDGFGRRSVSFSPLKVLRADFVKVDGSIVRKLATSELARTKLNAIVRVAEALRIQTVAECVEEQAILARLKTLGVSHAQGFGLHKPQPLATFSR
jgi:EAL domain-containing protein (putative c-di-GMP-specific phosphodiesterase class I)